MKFPTAPHTASLVGAGLLLFCSLGCNPLVLRFTSRAFDELGRAELPVAHKLSDPIRPDVGLSILWVGHATVLIQIHDKVIITDPVFTETVGLLAKRAVEPGIDPSAITRLDVILISHIHFDHFSFGSLDMLPRSARLFVPAAGLAYTPEFGFAETVAAHPWQAFCAGGASPPAFTDSMRRAGASGGESDGLRITPVPVQHFGGRYGFDAPWNSEPTWTGYVIEYKGITVFFAGDTGYNPEFFKEIGRRFHIDVALIPIAPVEPREYMGRIHADPNDALQIFQDVGAKMMIPIHYDTFFQGLEPKLSYAKTTMQKLIQERSLQEKVKMLQIGEQLIVKE